MSVKYYSNGETIDVSDLRIKSTSDYNEVSCTAAEYEAIDPHDEKTIYIVTYPDGSITKYLGDDVIGGESEEELKEDIAKIIEGTAVDVDAKSATKVKSYKFYNDTSLVSFKGDYVTEIESYAFAQSTTGHDGLTSVDVGKKTDGVTIKARAFQYCVCLETVDLPPNSVVENLAFSADSRLNNLPFENLVSIGASAFSDCSGLTGTIDLSNATLSQQAFVDCSGITKVILKDTISSIPTQCFWGCESLSEINLDNITEIGNTSLCYCGFTLIDNDTITTLGYAALKENTKLTSVKLHALTTLSSSNQFSICTSLKTVSLPVITSGLSEQMFSGCSSLERVDVGTPASIGRNAFYACSSLTTLIIRNTTMTTLATTSAFYGTPIADGTGYIYVPASLIDSYKTATNWSTFADQFRAIEDYPDIVN